MADQSQEQKLTLTSAPSTSYTQKTARKPVIKTVKSTTTKTATTPTKPKTLRQVLTIRKVRKTQHESRAITPHKSRIQTNHRSSDAFALFIRQLCHRQHQEMAINWTQNPPKIQDVIQPHRIAIAR
ncbi:unnamed protein product [Danaus chrysippus]|uniref:(African queen) hypothetical protein n=1 Tax=Danaus chrysippus TaxID=151541 RepID=A0A8J2QMY9_9NEOP|nr:unnamed protein product [Danaus chrysippus]